MREGEIVATVLILIIAVAFAYHGFNINGAGTSHTITLPIAKTATITSQPQTLSSENRIVGASLNWCFDDTGANQSIDHVLAMWQSQIPWFKRIGFNAFRLAIAPEGTNASTNYGFNFSDLTAVINLLGTNGFKVVLDDHNWNGSMYPVLYGSQDWFDFWMNVSSVYANNTNVYAYEPMNEPTPGGPDVQSNMVSPMDIQNSYGWLVSAIRATGDYKTIILPDSSYWQLEDSGNAQSWVAGIQTNQSLFAQNGLVESDHNYGQYYSDVQNNKTYSEFLQYYENKLLSWNAVLPTISGEWGFTNDSDANQMIFAQDWLQFLNTNNIGFFYWMSGYPSEFSQAQANMNTLLGIDQLPPIMPN